MKMEDRLQEGHARCKLHKVQLQIRTTESKVNLQMFNAIGYGTYIFSKVFHL